MYGHSCVEISPTPPGSDDPAAPAHLVKRRSTWYLRGRKMRLWLSSGFLSSPSLRNKRPEMNDPSIHPAPPPPPTAAPHLLVVMATRTWSRSGERRSSNSRWKDT